MKKTVLCLMFLSLAIGLNAHNGRARKSDIEKFKSRPLLVVLETENSEYSKFFNKTIKEIFKKYWTLNDSLMFMEKGVYKTKRHQGQEGWAIAEFSEDAFYKRELNGWNSNTHFHRYKLWHWQACAMMFSLIENHEKIINFIHRETLPNMFPSKGDLIYSLQMTESLFKRKLNGQSREERENQLESNKQLLKGKVLLIDSVELHNKVTLEKARQLYPYPIELVDYKKIEKAIVEGDAKYAYIQIVPITYPLFEVINPEQVFVTNYDYGHRIVNAKDGRVLSRLSSTGTGIKIMSYGGRIKAKQLKKFAKKLR